MKNLDLSTLPAKKRKQIVSCLRAGIQLLYFLFLPSVFTAAFNGVKYIFTQLGQGEKIEMTAFVSALLLVCAFTIVFGRFSAVLHALLEVWGMQCTQFMV